MDVSIEELDDKLKQQGHVVTPLLSLDEAASLKGLISGLETKGFGFQSNIQHRIAELIPIGGLQTAQLVCHPSLIAVLRQYLGDKFRCATFSSNTLLPQDGSQGTGLGWHPDYPYHDIDTPWPGPESPLGCQVLICLDEFRADNGGTMFMPDSHKHKPTGLEEDEEGTFPGAEILEAAPGSALIAHSAWWHRQTKNTSKATRTALLGNYTPGHIVPKDNMEKQWQKLTESVDCDQLSSEQQSTLERLLLGPFKRGLYTTDPRP